MKETMCDSELQETFAGIVNNPEIKITYKIEEKEVTAKEFYKDTFPQSKVTKKFTGFRYDIWDNDHEESIYPEDKEIKVEEKYKYSERTKII